MRSLTLPELRQDICSTLSWHLGMAKARPTSSMDVGFVSMEGDLIMSN